MIGGKEYLFAQGSINDSFIAGQFELIVSRIKNMFKFYAFAAFPLPLSMIENLETLDSLE